MDSVAPARISMAIARKAQALAAEIAEALDLVGVMTTELFLLPGGQLAVNELAPRVHNSGHWTIEAAVTSQFEQHIRAICGWPLGDPARHSDAEMTNLIGNAEADWHTLAAEPGARLHLYGKSQSRPGRKMGHVNRLFPKGTR